MLMAEMMWSEDMPFQDQYKEIVAYMFLSFQFSFCHILQARHLCSNLLFSFYNISMKKWSHDENVICQAFSMCDEEQMKKSEHENKC